MTKQPKPPEGKIRNSADEYAGFNAKRDRVMKITAWVAVGALLVTTAITFGVTGAFM